jgi:hypothetical protein
MTEKKGEGLLQQRIRKEFQTAARMQYSLLRPQNSAEVAGMLEVGMLPNILKIIQEGKQEFPLSPLIESIDIYQSLRNHTEQEKRLIILEHFKNCNLIQFAFETIQWFGKYFGEGKTWKKWQIG